MPHEPAKLHWREIASAPERCGVYAWYFAPVFSAFDRASLETSINSESSPTLVETFLERHLLQYFRESPYQASIRGPLKAPYSGVLNQDQSLTSQLSSRLTEDPDRRIEVWDAIEAMAPFFASPLYIGMAGNLRTRLRRHKQLIEAGLEEKTGGNSTTPSQALSRDHSFASEIVSRAIPTNRLFVYVLELKEESESAVDIENLLNRINFPLIGRN